MRRCHYILLPVTADTGFGRRMLDAPFRANESPICVRFIQKHITPNIGAAAKGSQCGIGPLQSQDRQWSQLKYRRVSPYRAEHHDRNLITNSYIYFVSETIVH